MDPIEGFEIIDNRDNKELDHRIWSELAGMQLIYNKLINEKAENGMNAYDDNEFISLSHYRRRIDPDCINRFYVPQPVRFQTTLAMQYAAAHNIEDLKLCGEAVKEEFPHLLQHFERVMNGNILIPYTIGIMTVGQFKDYMNFLFKILDNVHKKIGTETFEDRIDYIKRHPEWYTGKEDNKPEYQARIEAFLAERLATAYWLLISQKAPVFPAKVFLLEKDQKI
jgi:hypothetical protein